QSGLWTADAATGVFQLRATGPSITNMVWSADAARIAFDTSNGTAGNSNAFVVNADGRAHVEPAVQGPSRISTIGFPRSPGEFVWSTNNSSGRVTTGIWVSRGDVDATHAVMLRNEERVGVRPRSRQLRWPHKAPLRRAHK